MRTVNNDTTSSMSDFNYDQFPLVVLEYEASRVAENIAILSHKHELLVAAMAKQALDSSCQPPQADIVV